MRKCAQGLADYLKAIGIDSQGVVIGYDTRFLSKDFADAVASVLAGSNIKVYLCTKAAPTPVVSFNVLHYRAAGAVIITASHNPHNWNGFKFKPEYAGSATQEITDALECKIDLVNVVYEIPLGTARSNDLLVDIDPDPPYIKSIEEQVSLKFIKEAGLHVGVDSMFGSGSGYIRRLLSGGLTTVRELHSEVNPSFPGMEQPEPIAHNLLELSNLVIDNNLSVGIALDWGMPAMGGPIVTAGGLVFIAATMDDTFRSFDSETGDLLWSAALPAGAQSTPMTYQLESGGRQFVVIAAGGHATLGTTPGDAVIAFALPLDQGD